MAIKYSTQCFITGALHLITRWLNALFPWRRNYFGQRKVLQTLDWGDPHLALLTHHMHMVLVRSPLLKWWPWGLHQVAVQPVPFPSLQMGLHLLPQYAWSPCILVLLWVEVSTQSLQVPAVLGWSSRPGVVPQAMSWHPQGCQHRVTSVRKLIILDNWNSAVMHS